MQADLRKAKVMQRILDEIRMCLENGCYVAALALALTLPDICGKAECPKAGNGERYIRWYKKYVGDFRKQLFEITAENEDSPHLDAEKVYLLRCALLHSGNMEVNDPKKQIKEINLIVNDKLIKEAFVGSVNRNRKIVNVSYSFDPKALCNVLVEAAEKYLSTNKEAMSFAQIRVFDKSGKDKVSPE